MTPLERLQSHVNNEKYKERFNELVPFEWRVLFRFLDWLMWTNENGDSSILAFAPFVAQATKKLNEFNFTLDNFPRIVCEENHIPQWFKCERTFDIATIRGLQPTQRVYPRKVKNKVSLTVGGLI